MSDPTRPPVAIHPAAGQFEIVGEISDSAVTALAAMLLSPLNLPAGAETDAATAEAGRVGDQVFLMKKNPPDAAGGFGELCTLEAR